MIKFHLFIVCWIAFSFKAHAGFFPAKVLCIENFEFDGEVIKIN